MVGSARLASIAFAFAIASAHIASHDNILRIQLWDAEGLSREPITTPSSVTTTMTHVHKRKSKVHLESLYSAMLEESYGANDFGRFTRHKVRHKRRRPRDIGTDSPWKFHAGAESFNVAVFDEDTPWSAIETVQGSSESLGSAVSDGSVNEREVSPPMTLQQDEEEAQDEEVKKQLPVVPKCCPSGQNLSATSEIGKWVCSPSFLTFQPVFYQFNVSHMWSYDSNVFETIVGNPCSYDRYKLEPDKNSADEFNLLINGSLFTPNLNPYNPFLGTREYCMETFWDESNPAGVTLPLICFSAPEEEAGTSVTLIVYATGLIISVPFLLATAVVYTFITELRDTHGKALACHSICLAIAFSCLAATQLAGHAFPKTACTIMAYLIQFSFVSCFFWLNVMCYDTLLNVRRYINTTVSRRAMRKRFAWYCAYAVILPLGLLIVTITMELAPAVPSTYLKPNFGVKGCWFKSDSSLDSTVLPYFYGPVAAILLANIIIFFLTSRAFATHYDKLKDVTTLELTHSEFSTTDDWVRLGAVLGEPLPVHERTNNTTSATSPSRERPINYSQRLKKYQTIFRTCCMLSIIMGLSWVMEVVSWAAGAGSSAVSVWSVFDVINALQGVVIFAIYVLQQPVRSKVKFSKLCSLCRKNNGSEVAVLSERTSIDCGTGRRDYV